MYAEFSTRTKVGKYFHSRTTLLEYWSTNIGNNSNIIVFLQAIVSVCLRMIQYRNPWRLLSLCHHYNWGDYRGFIGCRCLSTTISPMRQIPATWPLMIRPPHEHWTFTIIPPARRFYTAWALSKRDLRKQLIFKRSYTTILFSDI